MPNPHDENILKEFLEQFCRPENGTFQWKSFKSNNANTVPCPNEITSFFSSALLQVRKDAEGKARKDERKRVGREIVEALGKLKVIKYFFQHNSLVSETIKIVSSICNIEKQ